MKRQFDAACRQYAVKEVHGDGHAEWTDGLKSGFSAVKMLGKTEQQSYSGKNLFDTSRILPNERIIVVSPGFIVIQPPNPFAGNGFTGAHSTLRELAPGLVPGKRYTLRFDTESSRKYIYLTGWNQSWWSGTCQTITDVMLDSQVVFYAMSYQHGDPETDCTISNIQIEEGETATDYESYVGGIPSPNPLYPQEIRVNNATVQSYGRNLFPRLWEDTANGVTLTRLHDGGYMLNGVCTDNHNWDVYAPIPAGVYTFSCAFVGTLPDNSNARAEVCHPANAEGLASIENNAAASTAYQFTVTERSSLQFRIHLQQGHTYDHVKLYPFVVRGEYTSDTMPEVVPYYDGGEMTVPPLLCAVDGSCQSTYDSQTGTFVNWWWDKLTFNGTEAWSSHRPSPDIAGFYLPGALPEAMYENACWSNQTTPQIESPKNPAGAYLVCGIKDSRLRAYQFGFYDDALEDKGLANWKAHLAKHPLEIWVARNEPEITNIGPNRLTCPTGYGQIVQVAGDLPDCPMEVRYLSHGGNLK